MLVDPWQLVVKKQRASVILAAEADLKSGRAAFARVVMERRLEIRMANSLKLGEAFSPPDLAQLQRLTAETRT